MNNNDRYKRLWRIYEKNTLWINDFFGVFKQAHVEKRFQPLFQRELEKEYFSLHPRARKYSPKKLTENDVNRVRERVVPTALAYIESRSRAMLDIAQKLNALAPLINPVPLTAMNRIKVSDTSTYRSQGYGQNSYARGALKPAERVLSEAGFLVEVRTVMWKDVLPSAELNDVYAYELWANTERYVLDALRRASTQSVVELAAEHWKNGQNPAVYNPFLSPDDFDKSLELAGWS